jgi:RHS repeat-associated protein
LVIDNNSNVWVAHGPWSGTKTVGHLLTDGTFIGNVDLNTNCTSSELISMVAVDNNGKIWALTTGDEIFRINPNGGPNVVANGHTVHLGAVDFCTAPAGHSGKEARGDFTGFKLAAGTAPYGIWSVIYTNGTTNVWGTLTWTASTTDTNQIRVEVRAADTYAQLSTNSFQLVFDSVPLTNVVGQLLEIRVTLVRPAGTSVSPWLHDLTVDCSTATNASFPPTLTTIATLKRTRQNITFPIDYDTLLAASDAADPDNDPISFKLNTISSGTLTKAGAAVTAGTTLIGPGESVEWTPPLNQNGSAMSAFTVAARDPSGLESSPAVQVKVEVDPANTPPLVNAGDDIHLTGPGSIALSGSVSDVEQSGSQLTIWWTRLNGPGDVTFSDVHSPTATATFSTDGDYVLQLSAFDGEFTVSDEITISTCDGRKIPLDVAVLLDVSYSLNPETSAAAQQAVKQLVSRLNLKNSPDSDKVTFVPIGDWTGHMIDVGVYAPPLCQSMALTSDPTSINAYVDNVDGIYYSRSYEDFEVPIQTAISYFKNDLKTRDARPVVVFISDFAIWEFIDSGPSSLANLADKLRGEGVRMISLGFDLDLYNDQVGTGPNQLKETQRHWFNLLSTSESDRFEVTDVQNLPDLAGSIVINQCQPSGDGLCAFAYDDKSVQYTSGSVSFPVTGKKIDLRSVTSTQPSILWTSTDPNVQFSDPTIASPTVTINSPVNGSDYVLDFAVNLSGSMVAHDSISVHLDDDANQPPMARCDVFNIQANSITNQLTVLLNDTDPNGDDLYIQSVTSVANGTVYVSDDRKALIYTPDPGYYTDDAYPVTLSYTIVDRQPPASGGLTATAEVQIQVHPVNVAPIALPDTYAISTSSASEEGQLLYVLDNDLNPNTQDVNPNDKGLTIVSVSQATPIGSATHPGTVEIDFYKKSLRYWVDAAASQGDQIKFDYTIEDIHGSRATATVTIVINNSGAHAPTPLNDYRIVFSDATSSSISVLDNDSDPDIYDSGSLTVTSLSTVTVPSGASAVWGDYFSYYGNPLLFFPHHVNGTATAVLGTYIFQYQVTDSQGLTANALLTISLQDRGPNPIANNDDGGLVAMNNTTGIAIPVLSNDQGAGLSISAVSSAGHGTATAPTSGPNVGKIVYKPNDPSGTYYGPDSFTYTITDPGNRSSTAKVTVAVYDPASTATVSAHLTHNPNLTPGNPDLLAIAGCDEQIETVREGVIELSGYADDDHSGDAFSYDLNLYDTESKANLFATSHYTVRVANNSPQPALPLGTLDARNLSNGTYWVELTVHGGNKAASDSKYIQLESSYKIGVLRFSEADASVSLGGVPINATRSYDSVNAIAGKSGDFGPGWTFALDDLQVEINETREMANDSLSRPFSRRSGGSRDVSLTLPTGQRTTFAFAPEANGLGQITAKWQCVTPGVPTTTTFSSDPEDNEYMVSIGPLTYWSRNPATTPEKYDLSRYLLKLSDGTLIHIARDFLGAHSYTGSSGDNFVQTYGMARVTDIETPNHEHYFFRHDGAQGFGNVDSVDHQFPRESAAAPALRVVRDPKTKLITAIHDRKTLDSSGNPLPNSSPAVIYEYEPGPGPNDPHKLARIRRLRSVTDSSNPVYDTTTNLYENANFPYLVTSIIGPRGVLVAKTTYDNLGRISRIDRPDGRWLEYHHDDPPVTSGTTARERIVDSEGHQTVQETDSRGNVLLAVDATGNQTSRTFDADDNSLRSEIVRDPFGNIVSQAQSTPLKYLSGQIQRRLTVQGIDSATGSKMVEEYDEQGHLTRRIDGKNTTITDVNTTPNPVFAYTYSYNASGQPTFSKSANSGVETVLSQQTYYDDSSTFFGMLHETIDAIGTRTIYDYYDGSTADGRFGDVKFVTTKDAAGNQLSQTLSKYDSNGNRTEETRYAQVSGTWTPYSTTTYTYDNQGRVTDTVDPTGGKTTTVYDAEGRTLSSRDRFGAVTMYAYDVLGDLVQTTYPDNTFSRSATYYADENGHNLRHVIREDRHSAAGPINGNLTIYDENSRPVATDRVKNVVIGFSDDGTTRKTTYISSQRVNIVPASHDSQTKYDAAGRVVMSSVFARSDNPDRWNRYDYDGQGRRWRTRSFVDSDGNDTTDTIVTVNGFDANGNTLWTLDPNQYEAVKTAIQNMTPEQISAYLLANAADRLTRQYYDVFNRLIQTDLPAETGAASASTKSSYDVAGRRWLEVDADNHAKAFVYDGAGRLSWVVTDFNPAATSIPGNLPPDLFSYTWSDRQADSTLTHYEYDDLGRLVKQTDGNQHATLFEYDLLDRRTKRTLPGTDSEEWAYDYTSPGTGDKINKVRHRDFNHRYILTTFDSSGRVINRAPDGQDAGVMPLTPAASRAVSFTYTPSGQRASMQEGNSSQVSGQLERHTHYVYDEFDRLRIKATPEGTLSYTYDPAGKIMTIDAQRAYTTPTDPVYNQNSLEQSASRPTGARNDYSYDNRNRLSTAIGDPAAGAGSVNYFYDASGNLNEYGHATVFVSTYQYNWRNQLRYLKTQSYDGTGPTIASFDYDAYDSVTCPLWSSFPERRLKPSGMRQGVAEIIAFNNHEYHRLLAYDNDAIGRLRAERIRTATDSWPAAWPPSSLPSNPASGDVLYDITAGYGDSSGYDKVGNRRSRNSAATTVSTTSYASYDADDRLGSTLTTGMAASTFDANGNTLQFNLDGNSTWDQAVADQFDFENHLIAATRSAGNITIVYDGDGNRVSKTVGSATTRYLVDDRNPTGYAQVLEEQDNAGTPLVTYIYGSGPAPVCQTRSGVTRYYGCDGQGTVRFLMDDDVNSVDHITDTYAYDAFGILTASASKSTPTLNSYLYTGQQFDLDLDMYYLRARYYNPNEGRFWAMDTYEGSQADPQSLHKYLYCHDNPINHADPMGTDIGALAIFPAVLTGFVFYETGAMISNHVRGRPTTAAEDNKITQARKVINPTYTPIADERGNRVAKGTIRRGWPEWHAIYSQIKIHNKLSSDNEQFGEAQIYGQWAGNIIHLAKQALDLDDRLLASLLIHEGVHVDQFFPGEKRAYQVQSDFLRELSITGRVKELRARFPGEMNGKFIGTITGGFLDNDVKNPAWEFEKQQ